MNEDVSKIIVATDCDAETAFAILAECGDVDLAIETIKKSKVSELPQEEIQEPAKEDFELSGNYEIVKRMSNGVVKLTRNAYFDTAKGRTTIPVTMFAINYDGVTHEASSASACLDWRNKQIDAKKQEVLNAKNQTTREKQRKQLLALRKRIHKLKESVSTEEIAAKLSSAAIILGEVISDIDDLIVCSPEK